MRFSDSKQNASAENIIDGKAKRVKLGAFLYITIEIAMYYFYFE